MGGDRITRGQETRWCWDPTASDAFTQLRGHLRTTPPHDSPADTHNWVFRSATRLPARAPSSRLWTLRQQQQARRARAANDRQSLCQWKSLSSYFYLFLVSVFSSVSISGHVPNSISSRILVLLGIHLGEGLVKNKRNNLCRPPTEH